MLISKIENYVLPQGWSKCCLPDFTDVVMGQSPSSDTYNKNESGIPFFQGKAEFGAIYPTVAKYCSAPNKIALAGATLLSVRAPVGPTNLAKEKCCIGRGLAAIHPVGGISPMFVLYLLRSIEADISKEGTGSTFSAINKQFVEEMEFGLPPLHEQHRIVAKIEELFSELDKGIENLKTAQAQLKVYRQALLKHAFEGKLTAQWRAENRDKLETAEVLLKRIRQERAQRFQQQLADWEAACKQGSKPKAPKPLAPLTAEELAELPELPEGWGWARVLEVCETVVDCHNKTAPYQATGIPLVRTPSIRDMKLNFDDSIRYVSQETYTFWSRRCPPLSGDILFTREAPMGEAAIIPEGKIVCMGQRIMLLRPGKFLSGKYLLCATQNPIFKKVSDKVAVGTGVKHLRVGDVERLVFPLCSVNEQNEIANQLDARLSEVDQLDQTITTSLQQAEALRQSILKKAFSGQLVKQDPHDEPASALLARIKAEQAVGAKNAHTAAKPRKTAGRK